MANVKFTAVEPKSGLLRAADFAAGDIVINGDTYVGKRESKNYKGAFIYSFKSEEGETIDLFGTSSLNRLMDVVTEGSLVQVIYQGKQKITEGPMVGREAHQWDVLCAQAS